MANRLRMIREKRGLSVDQLAQRVGASRSKIYKLENGSQRLTDLWITRLAAALDAAPADFLSAGGPSIPVSHYISAAFSDLASFDMPQPIEQLSPPRRLSRPEDCLACEVHDDSCDGIYPKGSLVILRRTSGLTKPLKPGDRIVVRHYIDNMDDGRVMEILLGHLGRNNAGDLVLLTRSNNRQLPATITIRRAGPPDASLAEAQGKFVPADDAALAGYRPEGDDQAEILGVVAMVIQPEIAA
ncbi:MAG: helix-turn-helix transcriptional regulator [Alphaproteobacteria bacterium]|jgi:transcriptional regulator with XRE-family HTH domain|nr:helix-turn-helix transcriptional regulator [Alphaproteobacteria bacterium]MDP6829440.1 helix-turn-helix transcriptional regulator [Alphaproteobacteria bacterium]MDP6873579.1 helix-turn-helix transcriptional regulator [Alphaproteobacteria bacterium]